MARITPPWEHNIANGGATIVFQHEEACSNEAPTTSSNPLPITSHASRNSGIGSNRTSSSSSIVHCPCCVQRQQSKRSLRKMTSMPFTKPDRKVLLSRVTMPELVSERSESISRKPSTTKTTPYSPLDLDLSPAELDMLWMLPDIHDSFNQEVARAEEEEQGRRASSLSRIKAKLSELRDLLANSKESMKHMWNDDDDDDLDTWRSSHYG